MKINSENFHKHAVLIPVVSFVFALAGCAPNGLIIAQRTEHQLDLAGGTCTATAVGAHTLLTAAHCLSGDHVTGVDGKPARSLWVAEDGHDHALIGVDIGFPDHADSRASVVQGEQIFMLGNPGDVTDIYRIGYVAGVHRVQDDSVTLYQLPVFFGDSGSAIFDESGRIVGVLSGFHAMTDEGTTMMLAVSEPMAFSPAQWARIR